MKRTNEMTTEEAERFYRARASSHRTTRNPKNDPRTWAPCDRQLTPAETAYLVPDIRKQEQ